MDVCGLIITAPRQVTQQQFSVPDPSDTDVVVRVEVCGLCTPEQRVYRGVRPSYPYWGGHEVAGIVEAAPGEWLGGNIGDRVAVLLMQRCGICDACRKGLNNHCAYLHPEKRTGFPKGPAGLADRLVVPPYKVFRVPPQLSAQKAALIEPVACVVRSIERARIAPGERIAVFGGGTMGLIHTALLSRRGCPVYVFDNEIATLQQAIAAGATRADPLDAIDPAATIDALTSGWGFDAVFCTRFGVRAITLAAAITARGGRIVLYQSIMNGDEPRFSANALHYRELEIIGTIAQTSMDVSSAVTLMSHQHQILDVLHTLTIPANRPNEAFEAALAPAVNRVLVDLRELAAC